MRDATERLLEALGPTIEAELDRAISETRQQLEGEFQARLQTAIEGVKQEAEERIKDVERESQKMIETRLQETVDSRLQEAVRESRDATHMQLKENFDAQMETAAREIRSEMQSRADEDLQVAQSKWAAERIKLQTELDRWHSFADAQRQLAESTSQTEILYRFLQLSGPFASSMAVYVSRDNNLSLWQSRRGEFPATATEDVRDPNVYFKSIVVRDKAVAAVRANLPADTGALDFLISCLERAIETFGMRIRTASPRPPVPQPANGSHV